MTKGEIANRAILGLRNVAKLSTLAEDVFLEYVERDREAKPGPTWALPDRVGHQIEALIVVMGDYAERKAADLEAAMREAREASPPYSPERPS